MTVLTPANQLTVARVLLIPVFVLLVVYHHFGWALAAFVSAGLTDALDGLIARRTGSSPLGAWLDPAADKLLLVTTFVVLTLPGLDLLNRIPIWLTVLVITRDVVIVATVAIVNLAIGPRTFRPSLFGKGATAIYVAMCAVILYENWIGRSSVWVEVWIYLALAITLVSAFHYIVHAARIINKG